MTASQRTIASRHQHAAGEGTKHFRWQRATAISNIPLTLFLVASIVWFAGADEARVKAYLSSPVVAVALFLLILSWTTHMRIGMQVIIEDYVHDKGLRSLSLMINALVTIAATAIGGFALLKLTLGY